MSKLLTPMKAIRAKCVNCCCGDYREVRECKIDTCPLHPYRHGHRPKEAPVNNESQAETE